jgi:hypothetical protein
MKSPRAGASTRSRDGRGLGIGTIKADTLAAGGTEVTVDRATGKVHNFWAASVLLVSNIKVDGKPIGAFGEGEFSFRQPILATLPTLGY